MRLLIAIAAVALLLLLLVAVRAHGDGPIPGQTTTSVGEQPTATTPDATTAEPASQPTRTPSVVVRTVPDRQARKHVRQLAHRLRVEHRRLLGAKRTVHTLQRRHSRIVVGLRQRLAARLEPLVELTVDFLCVHSYEAQSWSTNTGNGYYGGLQFGWHEWRTYGGQFASRADLASPAEQITAAISYHAVAGFWPWPQTARKCGLLP